MHEKRNLLNVQASALNKYVTALMEILFTENELANGIIKDKNSQSKKEALDLKRVDLLTSNLNNFDFDLFFFFKFLMFQFIYKVQS